MQAIRYSKKSFSLSEVHDANTKLELENTKDDDDMDGEADDCIDDNESEDYVDDYKDDRGSQDRWKNGRPVTRNSRRSTCVCVSPNSTHSCGSKLPNSTQS